MALSAGNFAYLCAAYRKIPGNEFNFKNPRVRLALSYDVMFLLDDTQIKNFFDSTAGKAKKSFFSKAPSVRAKQIMEDLYPPMKDIKSVRKSISDASKKAEKRVADEVKESLENKLKELGLEETAAEELAKELIEHISEVLIDSKPPKLDLGNFANLASKAKVGATEYDCLVQSSQDIALSLSKILETIMDRDSIIFEVLNKVAKGNSYNFDKELFKEIFNENFISNLEPPVDGIFRSFIK